MTAITVSIVKATNNELYPPLPPNALKCNPNRIAFSLAEVFFISCKIRWKLLYCRMRPRAPATRDFTLKTVVLPHSLFFLSLSMFFSFLDTATQTIIPFSCIHLHLCIFAHCFGASVLFTLNCWDLLNGNLPLYCDCIMSLNLFK